MNVISDLPNFERAIGLCEGNLIALSDQDDIWYPIRLERSEQEFTAHPQAGPGFFRRRYHGRSGSIGGYAVVAQLSGFVGEAKERLLAGDSTVLVKNRFVTGATVMFRSSLRESCLPIGLGGSRRMDCRHRRGSRGGEAD